MKTPILKKIKERNKGFGFSLVKTCAKRLKIKMNKKKCRKGSARWGKVINKCGEECSNYSI